MTTISTVAGDGSYGFSGDGGPATSAAFRRISGIAFDAQGQLYIGDQNNARVRRLKIASVDGSSTFHWFTASSGGKSLSLWNGTSNNTPPSGWETPGFDDSAWGPVYSAETGSTGRPGRDFVWCGPSGAIADDERGLFRFHFTLNAPTLISASFSYGVNDYVNGIYINGTLVPGSVEPVEGAHNAGPLTVPVGDFINPGDNVIAFEGVNIAAIGLTQAGVLVDLYITLIAPPPTVSIVLTSIAPTHGVAANASTGPRLTALSPMHGPASGGNTQGPSLSYLHPSQGPSSGG